MRWLVPTASATSRSDRPPIPPRAKASIRPFESCPGARVVVVAGGRHPRPTALHLAARLQALRLQLEVALGEPPHEGADRGRRPGLAGRCAGGRAWCRGLGDDLVRRQRGRPGRPLPPRPGDTGVDLGHLPHELGQARLLDLEALADLDAGAVERHDPLDRCRPLRPALHVGEDVPDVGAGASISMLLSVIMYQMVHLPARRVYGCHHEAISS